MTHGFGIIGCGMISKFHARAIQELPNAQLVACYNRSPEKAQQFAEEFGCKVYQSLEELLADPEVTIVTVATPSGNHMEPAVAAAEAGKHVVVEKPLEVTLERCDRIIKACENAGVKLGVIFPSRFHDAPRRLQAAVAAGRFGKLTLGDAYVKWHRTQEYYDSGAWRGTWELDGGGALMNQAIHSVDLLYWLMGPVKRVQAVTDTLGHDNIEVEDVAVAALQFQSGALGTIEATTAAYPGWLKKIEIHGTQGSAAIEEEDVIKWDFAERAPGDQEIEAAMVASGSTGGGASDPAAIGHHGHKALFQEVLASVDEDRPLALDGHEGRKAVEIILAVYHSARTGMAVELPLSSGPPAGDMIAQANLADQDTTAQQTPSQQTPSQQTPSQQTTGPESFRFVGMDSPVEEGEGEVFSGFAGNSGDREGEGGLATQARQRRKGGGAKMLLTGVGHLLAAAIGIGGGLAIVSLVWPDRCRTIVKELTGYEPFWLSSTEGSAQQDDQQTGSPTPVARSEPAREPFPGFSEPGESQTTFGGDSQGIEEITLPPDTPDPTLPELGLSDPDTSEPSVPGPQARPKPSSRVIPHVRRASVSLSEIDQQTGKLYAHLQGAGFQEIPPVTNALYEDLAELAKNVGLFDFSRIQTPQQGAQVQESWQGIATVLQRFAKGRGNLTKFNSLGLPRWQQPSGTKTGLVIAGTIRKTGIHRSLFILDVLPLGAQETIPVAVGDRGDLREKDHVLVLGVTVEDPSADLAGYTGDHDRILFANFVQRISSKDLQPQD